MSKSQSRQLQASKALLVFLVTSLAITGISFIDDQLWKFIMLGVGFLAYTIVGFLFPLGIIDGKQQGRDSYAAVFLILLFVGFALYQGITFVINWISNWPLWVKIVLLSAGILSALLILVYLIVSFRKFKVEQSARS